MVCRAVFFAIPCRSRAGFLIFRIVLEPVFVVIDIINIFMGDAVSVHIITADLGHTVPFRFGLTEGYIPAVAYELHFVFQCHVSRQL